MAETPALLLRCGCDIPFDDDGTVPRCPTHGVQTVCRVLRMKKPTFRGCVTGPHARPEDLAPFTGRLAGSES